MRRKLHVCYYMYARTALHCKRSDMSTAEYAYTVIQACMHHVCVCVCTCALPVGCIDFYIQYTVSMSLQRRHTHECTCIMYACV